MKFSDNKKNSIFSEIKKIRLTDKSTKINISNIALEYIKIGDSKESVEKILSEEVLIYKDIRLINKSDNIIIATLLINKDEVESTYGVVFKDEVRLIIHFENNLVSKVEGFVFYKAL